MTQHSRKAHFMESVARLAEGTTIGQAQSAIDALSMRLHETDDLRSSPDKGWGSRLVPLLDEQLGYYRPALAVLFGAVGLLLLIAVLNIASLLLTRALSREKEIAVRVAMGASPRQLVTQLVVESFVLSAAGAVLGLIAAAVALPIIINTTPVEIPRLAEAGIDLRALGLTLGVALVATLCFGIVPAFVLLRGQLTSGLKSGERGSTGGARRTYSVLVGAEVALACALLVSSVLLIRTVGQMMDTPVGVDAGRRVDDHCPARQRRVLRLERGGRDPLPDHRADPRPTRRFSPSGAGTSCRSRSAGAGPFGVEGQPQPDRVEDMPQAQLHSVSDGYFDTLGAEMAEGRAFEPFDNPSGAAVLIVNETLRQEIPHRRPRRSARCFRSTPLASDRWGAT